MPDADKSFVDLVAAQIGKIDVVNQIFVDVVDEDARLFVDRGEDARDLLRGAHDREDLIALCRQAIMQDIERPGDVWMGQNVQQCRRKILRFQQFLKLLMNVAIILEALDQAYREREVPQRLPIVAVLQNIYDFVRKYRRLVARAIDNWREWKAAIVIFLQ
jgi:hypothetical protein